MSGAGEGMPAGDRPAPDAPAPAKPGRRFDPGTVLGEAWATFSGAWPSCLFFFWGACATWWLILNLLVIFLASLNLAIGDPSFTPFLEFIRFLAMILVPAWLWLGQGIAFLKIARREPVRPGDLFLGGPYLLTALLAGVAVLALILVPCALIYRSAESVLASRGVVSLTVFLRELGRARRQEDLVRFDADLPALMAALLAVVALSYAAFFAVRVRMRIVPFLIVDRRAGVLESLRMSMPLTRGRVATLFLVHLSQFTINFAGWLACCVGLIVSLPLTSLISAVTYKALAADLPPIEGADERSEEM